MPSMRQCYDDTTITRNRHNVNRSKEVPYLVFDAANEEEALDFFQDHIEQSSGNLLLDTFSVSSRVNDSTFKITAYYTNSNATQATFSNTDAEPQFQFETGGGSEHLSVSYGIIDQAPFNAVHPGGINVDADGNVNGVDVPCPSMEFAETHYFRPSKVTTGYKKTIANLTGCINNARFRGFEAGEVMFLGASGSRNGDNRDDDWTITFKFAVKSNESQIQIGDYTIPSVRGWDYVWAQFQTEAENVEGGGRAQVKRVKAVFVEQIHRYADFRQLGIKD